MESTSSHEEYGRPPPRRRLGILGKPMLSSPPDSDVEAGTESPLSERPERSDISTNDPPSSLLNSHPPEELDDFRNPSYIGSDSDAIEIFFESRDSRTKLPYLSFVSVTSDDIVNDLDEGRLMPLLVESYDMLFPDELENGIADGTISLDISLESIDDDDDDDDEDEYEDEYEDEDEDEDEDEESNSPSSREYDIIKDRPRPGVGEKKGFINGIFTWMKRIPATDESELSVSLSEKNSSEKSVECDLKRKSSMDDLHSAYEVSEGPSS